MQPSPVTNVSATNMGSIEATSNYDRHSTPSIDLTPTPQLLANFDTLLKTVWTDSLNLGSIISLVYNSLCAIGASRDRPVLVGDLMGIIGENFLSSGYLRLREKCPAIAREIL